ncbi:DUF397 domain-containing protein [Nocardia yunnanensis]|uniref:DUF397 domain-containing protein n=1 Tax=Nocardia yunnanensis TaxID=2382165 RepID=A0A386ZCC0_9NOCA|nr:DUF397 domain-containing protein [Nocardia yunnanensis]AYF74744.1 DUF397 domain-containing protein [Nocardia yunnanensis]
MKFDWSKAKWRKSTYSGGSGGECVEVAFAVGQVGVRDSKDRQSPVLVFSDRAWDVFIASKVWEL